MNGFIEGDKNIFAVEFINRDGNCIRCLLWINGLYLGTTDDAAYTKSFLHYLNRIVDFPYVAEISQDHEILAENVSYCINKFIDTYDCPGEVMISLGETFDDFSMRCFRYPDHYLFLWKKHDGKTNFSYPGYPEGAHSAIVKTAYLTDVIKKFTKRIEQLPAESLNNPGDPVSQYEEKECRIPVPAKVRNKGKDKGKDQGFSR